MFSFLDYKIQQIVVSPNKIKQEATSQGVGLFAISGESHISNTDSDSGIPAVSVRFESADHEPGRFWLTLVQAVRKASSGIGQEILSEIRDHHSVPGEKSLALFADQARRMPLNLIFYNSESIVNKEWWSGFLFWLSCTQPAVSCFLVEILNADKSSTEEIARELSRNLVPDIFSTMAVMDVWWLDWFSSLGENLLLSMKEDRLIQRFSADVIIPHQVLLKEMRCQTGELDFLKLTKTVRDLSGWLEDKGEWLESARYSLILKDFERTGNLFEQHLDAYMDNHADGLTAYYYLLDLPSVLLTSRPYLSFLTSKACFMEGLQIQSGFYLNSAENLMASMERFSRDRNQLMSLEINDHGMTFAQLSEKINGLQMKQ